jgi:hypothetical protein
MGLHSVRRSGRPEIDIDNEVWVQIVGFRIAGPFIEEP